ncbi:MAG: hypothetical protein IPG89_09790 [Bacteroidetes bacterium]|nr:hypothetical protein [Bacteroidota bacterium]
MKNSQSTSFSKMFLLSSFIVLSVNISLAQTTDSQIMRVKKVDKGGKGKTDESSVNTNKSSNSASTVTSTPPPIVQPNYEEMSKGRVKAVAEEDNNFAKPTPVTYVGDEKSMTEVNYTIDSQQSNFDNLKNMIDLRNKVHASNNHATLTQTAKYTQLLSDITTYRAKFNADVDKKGFENCSKREQSLFLSLLKQEGKQEEYKMYSSKLKQD